MVGNSRQPRHVRIGVRDRVHRPQPRHTHQAMVPVLGEVVRENGEGHARPRTRALWHLTKRVGWIEPALIFRQNSLHRIESKFRETTMALTLYAHPFSSYCQK